MPAIQTSLPSAPVRAAASKTAAAAPASRARRRRALLQLARRHGEVRVVVREGGRAAAHAVDVLELLDELNEAQRLRWGGLRTRGAVSEVVYLNMASSVG